MPNSAVFNKSKSFLYKIEVSTSLQNLSDARCRALEYQVKAINLADFIQSLQLNQSLNTEEEYVLIEKIANYLEKAAKYLDQDLSASWDAQACRKNAHAIKSGNWKPLRIFYLEQFKNIRQPSLIAPIPAMHNHPVVLSGFVALITESSMSSALFISHPNQLDFLNSTLYPDCPIGMVQTLFVGAQVVKATNIHHPPYFIPEYLPDPPETCMQSVGYLLNTYTAQSVNHTLAALEPFWLPEQLAEIRQLFETADANEVQAALISLHNSTHFLGSQPLNQKDRKSAFMLGVDEELRADSGSNVGLDALGYQLFDPELIKVVILMDILDRSFKYTLAAPSDSLKELIISHHDAAAGQMRLNALRQHGALKKVPGREMKYYLDYQACLDSDRIILAEIEALDRLSLESPRSYQIERLDFLTRYLGTDAQANWTLDPFYNRVRDANPWLSAQLFFDYPVERELQWFAN
jgi:hypothetical protein